MTNCDCAHLSASSAATWRLMMGMNTTPEKMAQPVPTTIETQVEVVLETASQVLFLLPVCESGQGRQ